jgi:type IV pilus assembly protein PilA
MNLRPPPSRAHAGFSLVELMMVVAVIAILALIALPSIRDRLVRQQVVEALPLVDFAKQAIGTQWGGTGKLPADNAEAGLPPADRIISKYVASVQVRDGGLVVAFSDRVSGLLAGKKLSLRPATVDGYPQVPVTWLCGHATAPPNMTVHGPDETTLDAAYLPLNCKGTGTAALK